MDLLLEIVLLDGIGDCILVPLLGLLYLLVFGFDDLLVGVYLLGHLGFPPLQLRYLFVKLLDLLEFYLPVLPNLRLRTLILLSNLLLLELTLLQVISHTNQIILLLFNLLLRLLDLLLLLLDLTLLNRVFLLSLRQLVLQGLDLRVGGVHGDKVLLLLLEVEELLPFLDALLLEPHHFLLELFHLVG